MSTIIYYFSTTGNSLSVARGLAERLDGAELVPIRLLPDGPVSAAAGTVGIVTPVYGFGLPRIVERFAGRLTCAKGAYVFGVATYGGSKGGTLPLLNAALRPNGSRLAAAWTIRMPNNYMPLGGAWAPEKQERAFAAARDKLDVVAAAVRDRRPGKIDAWPVIVRLITDPASRAMTASWRKADGQFTVSGACTHCGICARVCPVHNIEMVDKTPQWKHECEQCYACMQWCPVEAIDWTRITVGRKRYHHPQATWRDFA